MKKSFIAGLLAAAGFVGIARANPGVELSAGYFRGLDNVGAGKTVFTSEFSPDQEHDLNACFNGIKIGIAKTFNKLAGIKIGLNGFYGHASDSSNRVESYGTDELEGSADFDLDADAFCGDVSLSRKFKFLKRLGIEPRFSLRAGYVAGELNGRGYVSSPSGDFAVGNTLESELGDFVYSAALGADAFVYLDKAKRLRLFVGASYGVGNKAEWKNTKTKVDVSGFGTTTHGEGRGETSGGASLRGLEGTIGISYEF
jgi:hypothetical protein